MRPGRQGSPEYKARFGAVHQFVLDLRSVTQPYQRTCDISSNAFLGVHVRGSRRLNGCEGSERIRVSMPHSLHPAVRLSFFPFVIQTFNPSHYHKNRESSSASGSQPAPRRSCSRPGLRARRCVALRFFSFRPRRSPMNRQHASCRNDGFPPPTERRPFKVEKTSASNYQTFRLFHFRSLKGLTAST